ncbi:MAG: Flp pilus assembly complex ATPase component TadA [Syntrophales bacterium]|nr:Flp pilus assembly complex ATPase component TadA [Syntrophales bacterium]
MKHPRFNVSLYVLVPIIFGGIALLSVITTHQILKYTNLIPDPELYLKWWGLGIGAFSFLCALLITWLLLKPMKSFIAKMKNIPAVSRQGNGKQKGKGDDLKEFNVVFEQVSDLLSKVEGKVLFPEFIGQGKRVRILFNQIMMIRPEDRTVLILGEPGTGKSLLAKTFHNFTAKNEPFVIINCEGLAEQVLEAELFGYEKGSYTGATSRKIGKFEEAGNGTLYLHQVSALPLNLQARLLRVLETGEFKRIGGRDKITLGARVIASTDRDIRGMIKEGTFRDDFYYRLNVVTLYVPPLRDRKEDIPLLVDYFIQLINQEFRKGLHGVTREVMDRFLEYTWPGNVAELEKILLRAASVAKEQTLIEGDFPEFITELEAGKSEPTDLEVVDGQWKRLGELLVEARLLDEMQLEEALAAQRYTGLRLGKLLVQQGFLRDSQIVDILSHQLRIERYLPDKYPVDLSLSRLIPMDFARKYQAAPLRKTARHLVVAMPDPTNRYALDLLRMQSEEGVAPVICTEREFDRLMGLIYDMPVGSYSSEARPQAAAAATRANPVPTAPENGDPADRFIETLIAQAVREGATDIHITPQTKNVRVRFRVNGSTHDLPDLPKSMSIPVITWVKDIANIDSSIRGIPQEGRFVERVGDRDISVVVSSIPSIHGESLILHLTDLSTNSLGLEQLGLTPKDLDGLGALLDKPQGLILLSGPEGSGKSTTLYAMLRRLAKDDAEIFTLEDPVKYPLAGVTQIEYNPAAGMTLAASLRLILKQDPDVVYLEEIRDGESAALAVQTALANHRFLSTLPSTDAAGAIARLAEMGVDRFPLATALSASISQRLVRTICPACREPYEPSEEILASLGLESMAGGRFFRGAGCPACKNTGFKGQTALFEILVNDNGLRETILKGADAAEIRAAAGRDGNFRPLKQDAFNKVLQGVISLEDAVTAVKV